MAEKTMDLVITQVDQELLACRAVSLNAPGIHGDLTVLAHHSPLVTLLKAGTLTVTLEDGQQKTFSTEKGILEVKDNEVTVLI